MPDPVIGSAVFKNFGTIVSPSLINLKLDFLEKAAPPFEPNTPFISYDFQGGKAQNADGTYVATTTNIQFNPVSANVPGWGDLKSSAVFAAGSSMKIAVPASLHPMETFGVEAVVNIAGASGRMNIIEGQKTPLALFIEPRGTALCLVGSVCDSRGWTSVAAEKVAVPVNQWVRLAMVFTGDDIVLLINGQAVSRRVISKATLVGFGKDDLFVGTWPDGGRFQFIGQMAGLKIWNALPSTYWPAVWTSIQKGLGEIDSKYAELGGVNSFLGAPTGEETAIGKGRYRTYQRGVIYWAPDSGAHEVHGAILTQYNKHQGATGSLGFPLQDELPGGRPGSMVSRFEYGAIYWSPGTGAWETHGAIFAHYLYKGGDKSFLGLPVSDEMNCANGQGRESRFQGGTIFWSSATGAFEVHGAILAKYLALGGPGGFLGFPISDETDVVNSSGQASGGKLSRFQGGTIYWSPASGAFEVHGDIRATYEKLGGPLSSGLGYPVGDETGVGGSDIRFNDFQKGIMVWKPGIGSQMFTQLEVRLGKVESGSIDDGIDWFKADKTAEVITYTTVQANGSTLDNGTRRPGDHAGSDYDINTRYTISPIRSTTGIYLKIRVDDWDMVTANDYLATYEKTFDIRSFWGQLGGDPPGVYVNQNSTSRGGDAPGMSTIRFSFSIQKPPYVDPNKQFREQCWWRFDNFSTPTLSRQMFADVFSDVENVENWWDEAMSPFDSIYYESAYKGIASGGNCFGISTEAVFAMVNQSLLVEPIYNYKANPSDTSDATEANLAAGLKRLFNEKHGYQVGAQVIDCILGQILDLDVIQPLDVYSRVKYYLATGDYPVLCMNDLSRGSGHCVMPYKCVDGAGAAPHRIYVGDPNKPWRGGSLDDTYVEINKNNTFKTVNCPASYASGTMVAGLLPSTFMEVIPYHVLRQQPRTPFWEIMAALAFLLGGLIVLAGDAQVDDLTSSNGKSFFKTIGSNRYIAPNAIPGLGRLPLFDVSGKAPEIYAQKGRFPDGLEMKLKGTKKGVATSYIRSATNAIRLNIPVSANVKDTVTLAGLQGSRPELKIVSGDKPKVVNIEYSIIKDKTERPKRTYKLSLGAVPGDAAIFRAARTGSGVEIKMPGAVQPLAMTMKTLEAGRIVTSEFSYQPKVPGETIRIRPRDSHGSAAPLILEKLNKIDGLVVERMQINPKIV